MLKEAYPPIQYRIRSEIFGERPSNAKMIKLQEPISADQRIIGATNLQQPAGWLGNELHGTVQLEGCIRLLREKGVESNHSVIARALDAIVKRGEVFDRGSLFGVRKILEG